jgi:signal peptidase I
MDPAGGHLDFGDFIRRSDDDIGKRSIPAEGYVMGVRPDRNSPEKPPSACVKD